MQVNFWDTEATETLGSASLTRLPPLGKHSWENGDPDMEADNYEGGAGKNSRIRALPCTLNLFLNAHQSLQRNEQIGTIPTGEKMQSIRFLYHTATVIVGRNGSYNPIVRRL